MQSVFSVIIPVSVVLIIKCTVAQLTGISTYGKHAVVCGRSKNVGLPIAVLLHSSKSGDSDTCKYMDTAMIIKPLGECELKIHRINY